MSKYTEADLDQLTDEERAALQDGEAGDDPAPATMRQESAPEQATEIKDDDEEDDADKGAADADAGDDGKPAADADGDAGEGADAKADTGAADDDKPAVAAAAEKAQTRVPLLDAQAPENAETRLTEIANQKAELSDQLDNGDITGKEFQIALDKLNKEERDIERQVDRANIAAELEQNRAKETWLQQVDSFIGEHPEYRTSQLRYQALDATVRQLAADAANKDWTGDKFLAEAHKIIEADLGAVAKPAKDDAKPASKADEGKKPAAVKKPIETVPTLAKLPAADMSGAGDGEFASLDRLLEKDPLGYEQALAALPEAKRERYLASN
jgi:hypothetical protein